MEDEYLDLGEMIRKKNDKMLMKMLIALGILLAIIYMESVMPKKVMFI